MNKSVSSTQVSGKLVRDLIAQLRSLPYPAFLDIVCAVLKSAYECDVTVLRQGHRRRNADGGVDFMGTVESGLTPVTFVAQAKQYSLPVPKRHVDELRGAAVRNNAHQCLIVSTSPYAKAARTAAAQGVSVPIRLITGEELVRLMARHEIGVIETSGGLRADTVLFEGLANRHKKMQRPGAADHNHLLTLKVWFGEPTCSSD